MGYCVINHRKERYDIKTGKGRVQLAGRSAARSGRHDAGAHRESGEAAGELLPLRPALGRVLPRITARGLRPPAHRAQASSVQASKQALKLGPGRKGTRTGGRKPLVRKLADRGAWKKYRESVIGGLD